MSGCSTEYDVLIKTVILGDSGVGKSSLLHRYADNDWSPMYIATIGVDFKIDTFETQGKIVKVQMWDTAGQERFKTICAAYYRGAHCIMLVYDVTNRETFDNIKNWMREVDHYAKPNIPLLLVGNKVDKTADRVVSKAEADEFAGAHNMQHVEASAKSSQGVHQAFRSLVDHAISEHILDRVGPKAVTFLLEDPVTVQGKQTCLQRFMRVFGF